MSKHYIEALNEDDEFELESRENPITLPCSKCCAVS